MISKTFRGDTMMQVLDDVKSELGSDALIVSVRQVPIGASWQVWKKPQIEVVAVRVEQPEHAEQAETPSPRNTPVRKEKRKPEQIKNSSPVTKSAHTTHYVEEEAMSFEEAVYQSEKKAAADEATTELVTRVIQEARKRDNKRKTQEVAIPQIDEMTDEAPQEKMEEPASEEPKPNAEEKTAPEDEFADEKRVIVKELSFYEKLSKYPELDKMIQQLSKQGIDPVLVERIATICMETLNPVSLASEKRVGGNIRQQLVAYIRTLKEPDNFTAPQIIYIIGTSGSGKTNLTAKIAARYEKTMGFKVSWICADTIKTGGITEARTFAEAIGTPIRFVYTPDELFRTVSSINGSDLILVDTPAFNSRKENNLVELGELLTVFPQRLTWLVLPSTMKESDLNNVIASVSPFKIKGLVYTKLDETNTFGNLYNIAWRTQLPLIYYCFGQRILNDIFPARPNLFVEALFEEKFQL